MTVWMYLAIETAVKEVTHTQKALPKEFQTALSALKCAIDVKDSKHATVSHVELKEKSDAEIIAAGKFSDLSLNTIDEMITVSLASGSPSIKDLLQEKNMLAPFMEEIKRKSKGMYCVSNITAEQLCELATAGDLETIKQHDVSSYIVDTIITGTKPTGPELYLGQYNALMIAVAHRQSSVVAYFIEQIGANLDLKGGRKKDLSILSCAGQPGNGFLLHVSSFFPAINVALHDYLSQKIAPRSTRSYRDALSEPVSSEHNIASMRM